jgi:hypothetical protein
VLRPLVTELSSESVRPALLAPAVGGVEAAAADVELTSRRVGSLLYVIAVRRGREATSLVQLSGLPRRRDGSPLAHGDVVFEYVQSPLPPPIDPAKQASRRVALRNDGFHDWFGPDDVHVYRFNLG